MICSLQVLGNALWVDYHPDNIHELMIETFYPYLDSIMIIFISYNFLYTKSEVNHMKYLRIVFQRLVGDSLYAKFLKYLFWLNLVSFIGHVVTRDSIMVSPTKMRQFLIGLGLLL